MKITPMTNLPSKFRYYGMNALHAFTLALIVVLAMPAHAADERGIKTRFPAVYPELAKRMKITGSVKVLATVDAEGKVTDVKTVSGNHMLSSAAEDAIKRWKFVPGDGVSSVEISIEFNM